MKIETGAMEDETRSALASGRASPAVSLLIDSALSLRGLEDQAGAVLAGVSLESETPAMMRDDALERAIAAIDALPNRAPMHSPKYAPKYVEVIRFPRALREAVADAETARGWTFAGPGIRSLQLGLAGDAQAEVLRIAPGARTPRHTHAGSELTLCLVGGFSDGRGSYGPGDVSEADPSVTHQPVADADGPCFVLAVTDGRLKLTGLLGAIQRLAGL
jgi:putative transcriptional regulator